MKPLLSLLLITFSLTSTAQTKYLISGSGWKEIGVVDSKTAELIWSMPLEDKDDCNDIELTSDKNILIAAKKAARLINWNKEVIWEVRCLDEEEINTATEIKDKVAKIFGGRYFIGVCGKPSRIEILDDNGKKVKEIEFNTGIERAHGQFRQIKPLPSGDFYVPVMGAKKVMKFNSKGEKTMEVDVEGNPFSIEILKDNKIAVSCGDAHKIMIIDTEKSKVVDEITENDIISPKMLFVSEVIPTKKGGYIMTNWNGHSKNKSEAKLFEIDKNNNVIWTLPDNDKIKNISTAYPLPNNYNKK